MLLEKNTCKGDERYSRWRYFDTKSSITSTMLFSEFYPDYFTATILEWKHLLKQDKYKDVIISSLQFLVKENRLKVYAFCIMSNHIHVIWQVQAGCRPKEVQLSFMKFTAQMIIKDLRNNHKEVLEKFKVKASDRTYQIWERNALSTSLWNQGVFKQKLDYVHNNPVVAGLCRFPEEYKYSSASFYEKGTSDWDLLTHYQA